MIDIIALGSAPRHEGYVIEVEDRHKYSVDSIEIRKIERKE